MTPTHVAPAPPSASLVADWLHKLIIAFHSGHRALPLRSNRLLEQLHAEAEIVAGSARVLRIGMESRACPRIQPDLEQCLQAVRHMDQELTTVLCRTLITPLDAEDLKLLSSHCVRLVRQQTRIARLIASEGDGGLAEAQHSVAAWAESFQLAVGHLPGKAAHESAAQMRVSVRRALFLLRDERCRLLSTGADTRTLMRDLARIDVFEEAVEQMKIVDTDVARILLKWQ
ncbi:MAG: hypothetical protein JST93_31010 [Acidobacteria bacterium]|nr:hypothetical protein [Acidobacteriota bacterium]